MNRDLAARAFADYCLGVEPSPEPADWICRHQFLNPGHPLPPAAFSPDTLAEARQRLTALQQAFHWHVDHPSMWTATPGPSVTQALQTRLKTVFRAAIGFPSPGNILRFPAVVELDIGSLLTPPDATTRHELLHFLTAAIRSALPRLSDHTLYPFLSRIPRPAVTIRFPRRAKDSLGEHSPAPPTLLP